MTEKEIITKQMEEYLANREVLKRISFQNADIIITDPCYLFEHTKEGEEEYEKVLEYIFEDGIVPVRSYDKDLPKLKHLKNFIIADTFYGDWGCSVYLIGENKPIGSFCADAGLVGVFDLKEVHAMRPDFDWYDSNPHTCTRINKFTGEVTFEVKNDKYGEKDLAVVGRGNINFFSTQTGF